MISDADAWKIVKEFSRDHEDSIIGSLVHDILTAQSGESTHPIGNITIKELESK